MKTITLLLGVCAVVALPLGTAAAGPCTAEIENVTKLLASRDAGSGPTAGAHSDPADQQQVLPLWHGSGRPLRCRASRPTRSPSATASAAT